MPSTTATTKYMAASGEAKMLPPGWAMKGTGMTNRMAFYRLIEGKLNDHGTYEHPTLGHLPRPWELRKYVGGDLYYFNTATAECVDRGPRKVPGPPSPPPGSILVRKTGHGTLKRQETSKTPLHHNYQRVKILDDGSGKIGGMNAGVYVVKDKATKQLYVEKNFSTTDKVFIKFIKSEIALMKKLLHAAIVHYIASFVQESPFAATVYMEYCDRGSLEDLLHVYKKKLKAHEPDLIPESFIWHALVGIADALGFLQTGQSHVSMQLEKTSQSNWVPVLHRDIKPGNIFIRSRDTPGSTKPFYVILCDFGLAIYDTASAGIKQGIQGAHGSMEFHAPELAFDPYPKKEMMDYQTGPHTSKSDVWALACVMYGLCERDCLAHMDRRCWPLRSQKALGRKAKKPVLMTTNKGFYSDYLTNTIQWAGGRDPATRPDAWALVKEAKVQRDLWIGDANWKTQVDEGGTLPVWATKKHTI